MRAAGPYTQTDAVPYAAIVGCTARDRAIYRFIIKELGPPAVLGSTEPRRDCLDNPLASDRRRAEPTIKEHGTGSSHRGVPRGTIQANSSFRRNAPQVLALAAIA